MSIFLKHDGKFYEISNEVLARSSIPKELFEERVREIETNVVAKGNSGLSQYNFLDLSDLPDEGPHPAEPKKP